MQEKIEELITLINSLNLFAKCIVGNLSQEDRSISLIVAPSGSIDRFLDSNRVESFAFQILAKSPNQKEIIQALDTIKDELERNGVETTTLPNYVQRDGKSTIYTAIFKTSIEKFN
ncbi:hypothetical protein ACQV2S_01150 [Facklamia sp. P13064]|uniref:hypothetical protein n=1 Tax=Facklamia sp. P13064 TaxID=3421953 RepID=UPI003D182799